VGVRRPASDYEQRSSTAHIEHKRVSMLSSKSGKTRSITEDRKEVICTTTRILQGVTYPIYCSFKKTAGN
jgi:hypothetical protein